MPIPPPPPPPPLAFLSLIFTSFPLVFSIVCFYFFYLGYHYFLPFYLFMYLFIYLFLYQAKQIKLIVSQAFFLGKSMLDAAFFFFLLQTTTTMSQRPQTTSIPPIVGNKIYPCGKLFIHAEAFYSCLKLFSHAGSFLVMLDEFYLCGLTYSALENARVHHENLWSRVIT